MTLAQMKEARGKKIERMKALRCEADKRELTTDEETEVKNLRNEVDQLKEKIAVLEGVDEVASQEEVQEEERKRRSKPSNPGGVHVGGGADPDKELRGMLGRYSLLRAIRCQVDRKPLDGVERELSDEVQKRSGKTAQGFYVPHAVLAPQRRSEQRADLNTTTGAGAIDVLTDHANFIEALRNKTLSDKLGVKVLSGLVGEVDIPKKTGTTTGEWLAEAGSATSTSPTIGQVQLRSKTISARTDITRKQMLQTSMSMEALTRDDILETLALMLDSAVFNGSGVGNEPRGLLNVVSLNEVEVGSADLWQKIVELEEQVETENALEGNLAYVTSPAGRRVLKTTEKANATAQFIWQPDNTVNGYRAFSSTQIPLVGSADAAVLFGNWANALIGIWGSGLDVIVDPYTLSSSGGVRIVAFQDADVKFRHEASFARIVDLAI